MRKPTAIKVKRSQAGHSRAEIAKRRELFRLAYIANGNNATQAAITAGFSKKTAYSQGARLLKSVEMRQAIEEQRAQVTAEAGLTVKRTLRELARLAYFDPRKLYDEEGRIKALPDMDDDTAAAVAFIEVTAEDVEFVTKGKPSRVITTRIKLHDKKGALDMAMKHLNQYRPDAAEQPTVVVVHPPGKRTYKFEPYNGRNRGAG